jgi:hypothetical protein
MIKRAVNQIHSNYAQRFLLFDVPFIQHPHVDNDLAWFPAEIGLKTDSEPAVCFVVLFEAARCHCVGKNEK